MFVLGLCVGSFLNCAIYRIESQKSLKGRSFCPHCKHTLHWWDLFPVFSFLFLQGKCLYCKAKISWQYPAVEIATGLVFLLIFLTQSTSTSGGPVWGVGPALVWNYINLAFLFYIFSALIVIFIYDLKHYIIPDKVLFPAIIISLIFNFRFLIFGEFSSFIYAIIAAAIASGFFLAIFLVSTGKAMGFGDVKLAVLMGLLLGLPNILAALFLAFFFGAIIGVTLMIFKKKNFKSEIPFGPFLIAGTFIAIFYGNQIIQWYTNFFQI